MSKVEQFLTSTQEQQVIKAIKVAERNTSGEIRVHLEKSTKKPPIERALEVFSLLKMHKTEQRNGVLFYVAVESKKFAIIGDEGINKVIPANFWQEEKELILSYFKQKKPSEGLELAILEVGKKLKEFFPYQTNDKNELPDEISRG